MSEHTASGHVAKYYHAKIRAWERYKINLSNADCEAICRAFWAKRTLFLGRGQEADTSVHVVKWAGKYVRCVFADRSGRLITVLPMHSVVASGRKVKAPRVRKGDRKKPRKVEVYTDDEY